MENIHLTVTGAAGNIAYAMLPRLGELLSDVDMSITLKLLEVDSAMHALEGVVMELEDCAYPFIDKIIYTSDPKVAFDGTDWSVLIGAMPRKQGMNRVDLLNANGPIFKEQGRVINSVAKKSSKILVVGNPCNTNAYITMENAPDIPKENFYAMTMLDQHRAYATLAKKLNITCDFIEKLCVWGNHSDSMYVDYEQALVDGSSILEVGIDPNWFENDFISKVAKRGAEVIKARGASSAASAASAIIDSLITLIDKDNMQGWFSMGTYSNGEYGATPGTIVSYPCVFDEGGNFNIVKDLKHSDKAKEAIAKTFEEIRNEALAVKEKGFV